MDRETIRRYCLSFPHATATVQWGENLVFKVAGKMFCVLDLSPESPKSVSFKCTPEEFAELTERQGISPAPYAARYFWVSLDDLGVLSTAEVKRLIRKSYDLVFAKLPKKIQAELQTSTKTKKSTVR